MQKVVNLKGLKKLLQDNPRVICDFYADWCGPCKLISPKFQEFSEQKLFRNITFVKIDVDEAEDLGQEFKIQVVPTFIAFHNQVEIERFSSSDANKLQSTLEELTKLSD